MVKVITTPAGQLEIVALARHVDRDPANAGPGVEPGAQGVERPGRTRVAEARRTRVLPAEVGRALVEHGYSMT